jgi:CO/xanthine dehydrogenase Mo-binding subunit
MTTSVHATAPTVLAPSREELIRAMRRRHPRISDARLGKLLDHRLARGVIDVIRSHTGEIDIRLTAEMMRN